MHVVLSLAHPFEMIFTLVSIKHIAGREREAMGDELTKRSESLSELLSVATPVLARLC